MDGIASFPEQRAGPLRILAVGGLAVGTLAAGFCAWLVWRSSLVDTQPFLAISAVVAAVLSCSFAYRSFELLNQLGQDGRSAFVDGESLVLFTPYKRRVSRRSIVKIAVETAVEHGRTYERAVITLAQGSTVTAPNAYHDVDMQTFAARLRASL